MTTLGTDKTPAGQYLSEVEILRDHDAFIGRGPVNDFRIRRPRISKGAPGHSVKARGSQFDLPEFRQVYVQQQSHRGTKDSDSVSRQAA